MNSIFNRIKNASLRMASLAFAGLLALSVTVTSCGDMLETDSTRGLIDYDLNAKTDSIFFAFGVMQAMQMAADQYVFQGEMRGDNVQTTTYTDNDLRQLADFSATATNEYDSAYVYYRIINNCNYYLAHRDTTLYTGATNVTTREYAAIMAFRAWAYLQLTRNYGSVPFFTEPLTSISQINSTSFPSYNIEQITAALAPDMKRYSGYSVPLSARIDYNVGNTNRGATKSVHVDCCYIPIDVILGELYLESGDYANAAHHYTTYMTTDASSPYMDRNLAQGYSQSSMRNFFSLPSDFAGGASGYTWSQIFNANATDDIISYIPMAVNSRRGQTTIVPTTFGYDYYATSNSTTYLDEVQLVPSTALRTLSDSTAYYYYRTVSGALPQQYVGQANLGDQRLDAVLNYDNQDSSIVRVEKYRSGNIILFRNTTVYLHLAEALNRLGHPDLAFQILKEGINEQLLDSTRTWVSAESKELMQTTYPFLSAANRSMFPAPTGSNVGGTNYGIHMHGAGVTSDGNYPGRSPYQYDAIVTKKMNEIASTFNISYGTTASDSLQARINAMEDILCDEYQLEFAFEGTRWYDLMRLARHKNRAAAYGSNFGGQWLARKLQWKNATKDLSNSDNWYLPFR